MNDEKQSPLVSAVLSLDESFAELERLGAKINSMDLKSEFEIEHAQKLMIRFAECGEEVSAEVVNLSRHLNEARVRAETMAQGVAARADLLNSRKSERQQKVDEFLLLGEKVRELSVAMEQLKRPQGETLTDEDRAYLSMRLSEIEAQLSPLVEQAQNLRRDAQESKMKHLAQNADSLAQTLQALRSKLSVLNLPNSLPQ